MIGRTIGLNDFYYLMYGAGWTIGLSVIAFFGGGLVGAVLAIARTSHAPLVRLAAAAYIHLIQATPLLMQLFIAFFGFSLLGVNLPALLAAGVVLTIYSSAFLGEIWRGCLEAVPKSQSMAGQGLGLRRLEILSYIVVPQAARLAVPPTVGFLVQIVKNTSVTALIGFIELARAGQLVSNATFRPGLVFCSVAAFYFVVCFPLTVLSRKLEKRLHGHRTFARSA